MTRRRGPYSARLAIPVHYIMQSQDEYDEIEANFDRRIEDDDDFPGPDFALAGELLYYSSKNKPKHCQSATVRAHAPASFMAGVYECCVEKTFREVLSNAYAWAGLVLAVVILVLACLALPIEHSYIHGAGGQNERPRLRGKLLERIHSRIFGFSAHGRVKERP